MNDERVTRVMNDLSSLIVSHAGMTATEQYRPRGDADASDEYTKEHKAFVTELRAIRQRFENLITGIIED